MFLHGENKKCKSLVRVCIVYILYYDLQTSSSNIAKLTFIHITSKHQNGRSRERVRTFLSTVVTNISLILSGMFKNIKYVTHSLHQNQQIHQNCQILDS